MNELQGKQKKESVLIEELQYLIKEAIQEQIIADVPVGTFLSGGVDSSIITYESNRINQLTECFSIGFTENYCNELQYAEQLAQKYNIHMNKQIFNKEIYKELYSKLPLWYDEPFSDTSAFPTYLVSKLAKNKVTVVLSGDGGDEVFGGYGRYTQFAKERNRRGFNNFVITKLYDTIFSNKQENIFDVFCRDELSLLLNQFQFEIKPNKKKWKKKLQIPNDYDDCWFLRKHYNKELSPITRIQYLDLKTYLPGDILTKVDRASMAVSLETRVPLLSRKLIEFSFGLSEEDRCNPNDLKSLLKKSYQNELGQQFLYRKKQGFVIPSRYIKSELSPQEELLNLFRIEKQMII